MLYCDVCAETHGYGFTTRKEQGECELCKRRCGTMMNVMNDKHYSAFTEIDCDDHMSLEGFEMKQVKGFVPGTAIDQLHPGMRHIILSHDKHMFQGPNEIILAVPSTGKRIQIKF